MIVASYAPPQLHKLFDARLGEIARAGLPSEWSAFRRYYAAIRKAGHYLSVGELEQLLKLRQPTLSQQLARLREDAVRHHAIGEERAIGAGRRDAQLITIGEQASSAQRQRPRVVADLRRAFVQVDEHVVPGR